MLLVQYSNHLLIGITYNYNCVIRNCTSHTNQQKVLQFTLTKKKKTIIIKYVLPVLENEQ